MFFSQLKMMTIEIGKPSSNELKLVAIQHFERLTSSRVEILDFITLLKSPRNRFLI